MNELLNVGIYTALRTATPTTPASLVPHHFPRANRSVLFDALEQPWVLSHFMRTNETPPSAASLRGRVNPDFYATAAC